MIILNPEYRALRCTAITAGALAALMVSAHSSQAAVVTYADFSNTTGLTTVGNTATAVTGDGTVMRITPASAGQSGAFYSTSPVTLGANATFSTTFNFRFTSPGGWNPADGITFVLAASPSGLGGVGVGIGYQGVGNSVAVEFDTYNNGNPDGHSSNHVAIDTNGALTHLEAASVYGNSSCGFTSGIPPQNSYLASGCMSNGNLWSVSIGYDGTEMTVTMQEGNAAPTTIIDHYAIDVASFLGTNQAYVGFTGSTGSGWENHDILNWSFANTTELANLPEPGTMAILGLGITGLGWARRRPRR